MGDGFGTGTQARAELPQARDELERLQHQEAEAVQARTELAQARDELERLRRYEAETEQARSQLAQARDEIERLQHQKAEAVQARTELAQARDELERLRRYEAEAEQARSQLAQARNEMERLQRQADDASRASAELTEQFLSARDANRRMEDDLAELGSAMRQRQEEAAQAWAQASTEQKLREQVEAEQQRLIKQNEQLITSFSEIDERIRTDNNALISARRRASKSDAAMRQLTRQYETLRTDMEAQAIELRQAQSRSARANSELAQLAMLHVQVQGQVRELEEVASRTSAYQAEVASLTPRVKAAEETSHQMKTLLEDRQSEVQALKKALTNELAQASAVNRQAQWLQEVTVVLQKKPRLRGLLSSTARRQYSRDMLKESGLFDADFYLAKNPDVAETGDDPLLHYVRHGLREGRTW